jgi:hypothetical protein
MPARLLCVGNERDDLLNRCAILRANGYEAKAAGVTEAKNLLRTAEFDVIVLSAFLSREERGRVVSAAGDTPTLVSGGVMFAPELLVEVKRVLASKRK